MKKFLISACSEIPGIISSQRVAFLVVTMANVTAFLVVLGFIISGRLAKVPEGILPFATLLQGIATAGKVIQQRSE